MAERTFTLGERVSHGEGNERRLGTVTDQGCDPPENTKDLPGAWCRVKFDDGTTDVVNSVNLEPSETRKDQD